MIIIPNSKKDVFLCTYDVNYEDGSYKTKVLNSKNEEIFNVYQQIEAISNIDENQNLSYNSNVLRIKKENKYGLINMQGNEILSCEYEEITSIQGLENELITKKEGKYGVVNEEGKEILPNIYSEIQNLGKVASEGFIIKNEDNKYGIVDITNKEVLKPEYEAIEKIHVGNYYVVTKQGKQIVINKEGIEVLNGNYDKIINILRNPEDGVIYQKNNKYGVMNLSGESIIEAKYEEIKEGKTGKIIAEENGKYGIIDLTGKTELEFKYNGINYNEKADLYVAEDENYNNEILDSNYNVKLSGILIDLDDEKGYIEIRKDDEYKYYNLKIEEKNEADIFTSNTLFISKKNGKYGFVDKDNKVIVDYIYDDATKQNQYGFAGVKKDGKWGVINKEGKLIQEPIYSLEDNLKIDFIGSWYLGKDLNMNYYRK